MTGSCACKTAKIATLLHFILLARAVLGSGRPRGEEEKSCLPGLCRSAAPQEARLLRGRPEPTCRQRRPSTRLLCLAARQPLRSGVYVLGIDVWCFLLSVFFFLFLFAKRVLVGLFWAWFGFFPVCLMAPRSSQSAAADLYKGPRKRIGYQTWPGFKRDSIYN